MESSRTVEDLIIWYHVLIAGLSAITVLFLGLFIQEMRRGRGPMIESNWGGIGGGGGGWRMSGSLAYLLGMLGTATLLFIVLVHFEDRRKRTGATPPAEKEITSSPASLAADVSVTPAPFTPRSPVATPTP
jgi:hypothetical protein